MLSVQYLLFKIIFHLSSLSLLQKSTLNMPSVHHSWLLLPLLVTVVRKVNLTLHLRLGTEQLRCQLVFVVQKHRTTSYRFQKRPWLSWRYVLRLSWRLEWICISLGRGCMYGWEPIKMHHHSMFQVITNMLIITPGNIIIVHNKIALPFQPIHNLILIGTHGSILLNRLHKPIKTVILIPIVTAFDRLGGYESEMVSPVMGREVDTLMLRCLIARKSLHLLSCFLWLYLLKWRPWPCSRGVLWLKIVQTIHLRIIVLIFMGL